jgi:hypothetical protein
VVPVEVQEKVAILETEMLEVIHLLKVITEEMMAVALDLVMVLVVVAVLMQLVLLEQIVLAETVAMEEHRL